MAALPSTLQSLKISDGPASDKSPTTTVTLRDVRNEEGSGDDGDDDGSSAPAPSASLTSDSEPLPGLLQLPPELFDEVLNYLDPASTVLLALASKRLAWRFLLAHPPAPPPCLLLAAATAGDARRPDSASPSPEWSPWRALDDYVRAADDLAAAALRGGGRGGDGGGSHRGHRAGLLRTLDRDLPDLAYCHRCRRLHDPLLSFADPLYASPHKPRACCVYSATDDDSAYLSSSTFSSSSAPRSASPGKRAAQHSNRHSRRRHRRKPNSHDLPWRASRRALRCVAKCAALGDGSHVPLLRQVNGTRTSCRGGALAQVSVRARCRAGDGGTRVLLRRRQVIASVDKTPLALWLFGARLEGAPTPGADGHLGGGGAGGGGGGRSYHHIGGSSNGGAGLPRIHWICAHLAWMDRYAVFVDRLLRPLCARVRAGLDHPVHGRACFDGRKPFDPAAQEGHAVAERLRQLRNPTPTPTPALSLAMAVSADGSAPLGAVRSCDRCATDFCLDVAPLPAPFGWGFVLTTWMDPGVTVGGPARSWKDHDESRPDAEARPDDDHRPDVYERFEGVRGPGAATSTIAPRDLDRIRNYGWAERAAAGGPERYVAWESAQAVDPLTGRVLDPDPLDDGDC